jgi:putative transcriptional regulator
MNASLSGQLLISSPALRDPNFDRSIVLVLHHDEEGAVGVILNRPSQLEVADALPQWRHAAAPPAVLFIGGPVGPTAAICLARVRTPDAVEGWQAVLGPLGTFDLARDPDELAEQLEGLRVFSGYSGWGPGQLEEELAVGAWLVVDPSPDDALSSDPNQLWRTVLRRQGGRLALLAAFPTDPSLN